MSADNPYKLVNQYRKAIKIAAVYHAYGVASDKVIVRAREDMKPAEASDDTLEIVKYVLEQFERAAVGVTR